MLTPKPLTHSYLYRLSAVLADPMPGSDFPALAPPYVTEVSSPSHEYRLRDCYGLRLCRGIPTEPRADALTFVLNTLPQVRAVLACACDVLDTPPDRLPDLAMLRVAMKRLDDTRPYDVCFITTPSKPRT